MSVALDAKRRSFWPGRSYVRSLQGSKKAWFVEKAGMLTRRKCSRVPAIVDRRGWALRHIYGVPEAQLSMYPPVAYGYREAEADIQACAQGQTLPYGDRIVRFDKLLTRGRGLVQYALTKYHGYTPAELASGQVLGTLPYSDKDAQIDITHFQRHGQPYFRVVKYLSKVVDPKRGITRSSKYRGYENGYKYNSRGTYDSRVRTLDDGTEKKFHKRQYPLVKLSEGRADAQGYRSKDRYARMVPCNLVPAYCQPGQQFYAMEVGSRHVAKHASNKEIADNKFLRRQVATAAARRAMSNNTARQSPGRQSPGRNGRQTA